MKCPACGQWNRASFPVCSKCGCALNQEEEPKAPAWRDRLKDDRIPTQYIRTDLDGESITDPDARDVLAREMSELKVRKAAGREHQRQLRTEGSERGAAPLSRGVNTYTEGDRFWTLSDDPKRTVRVIGKSDVRPDPVAPISDDTLEEPAWESRWGDPDFTGTMQLPKLQTSKLTTRLPSRRRRIRRLLKLLLILVFVGLAGAAGFFGYHYFKNYAAVEDHSSDAVVTASTLDGLPAHTIMIPGTDGTQIYIRELRASYVVAGGFASIQIADHTWYDDMEESPDEVMQVTLTPYLKTASGQQKPLDVIYYDITIPASPAVITQPDSLYYEVSTTMYTLKMTVDPGSTLTINGTDYSDAVDTQTGSVSVNLTVQPIGDNVYNIGVRSKYCRETDL